MSALKLVPVWAWVLLGLLLSTGYLYLRLDHTKTDLAGVTSERDIAITRAASISKTLGLQRQLTEDSNKATGHATEQAQHVTAAVAIADDRARSLQQQVIGATRYMVQWMPIYNVFASKPPKTQSSGQSSFGWTITWEEI